MRAVPSVLRSATPPRSSSSCGRSARQLDAPACSRSASTGPASSSSRRAGGWQRHRVPEMTQRALPVAGHRGGHLCDQQHQERPLLAATLPSGERIQFVHPAAPAARHGVDHGAQALDADRAARRLRARGPVRARCRGDRAVELLPFEHELLELKDAGRYAEFLRLAVRKHQTIVVSGKTGSGKTTFMKGLVEEVPEARAADHDPGHGRADAAEPPERRAPVLQQGRAGHGARDGQVAARSLPAHEAGPHLPGRGARRRVLLLRAPRGLGPPGQHHQRARRQLRAGLRADVADDPRERRRRRPAHGRDQVAARRRDRRRSCSSTATSAGASSPRSSTTRRQRLARRWDEHRPHVA